MSYLMRTWYQTDASDDDPGYLGVRSAEIPDRVVGQIVDVDWSERGSVQVTFLMPGRGPGR